jgi:multiple sugar transport system substrate-binding protein
MAQEKKNKISRREFLKKAGMATAGAVVAGSMLKSGVNLFGAPKAGEKWKIPLNQNRFKGMKVQCVTDSGWSSTIEIVKPHIMKECGIGEVNRDIGNFGEEYVKIVPQLMSKKPKYDFIVYSPMFFGDFVNMGALEPLDPYLAMFEGSDEYLRQVMPAYKNFYTSWGGKTYSFMVDGDLLMLHYLKPYFQNADYRKKFEKRFKMELKVPETWYDYLKVAQFFTEEGKGKFYGSQMLVNPPTYAWGYFFNMAAANGVHYFDENMNPTITTPEAEEALTVWKEILRWSPPGGENMGLTETINAWQSGSTVMATWWFDLSEFSAQQNPAMSEDQGGAVCPGWKKGNKIQKRSLLLANRVCSIPKNIPEERKLAAAYFIYRVSHQDYSFYYTHDEYSGSDPYMEIHYSDACAEGYTKPDPLRDITAEWPTNQGIFKTVETAKDHLKAGLECIKVGYPQFNWVGGTEFAESLGRNIQKVATNELKPKEALEKAAEEWAQVVQKYGVDKEKQQYSQFVSTAKSMGYM